MEGPNGIGLSRDEDELYVAETVPGRLWAYKITAPGKVGERRLLQGITGFYMYDSLAVDAAGNVCVATLINGGISILSPSRRRAAFRSVADPLTTNICFGGADLKHRVHHRVVGRRSAGDGLGSTGLAAQFSESIDQQRGTCDMAYLDRDGVRIYYEVHGSGPAVLLSHGYSATSAMWTGQIGRAQRIAQTDHLGHARARQQRQSGESGGVLRSADDRRHGGVARRGRTRQRPSSAACRSAATCRCRSTWRSRIAFVR